MVWRAKNREIGRRYRVSELAFFVLYRRVSKADDLQRRVEAFSDDVLDFYEPIVVTIKNDRFIKQLIAAATSVAANYRAARRARSHAEFTAKIGVVSEEADECEYWLGRSVRHRYGDPAAALRLHAEAIELMKIFARSSGTARRRHRERK